MSGLAMKRKPLAHREEHCVSDTRHVVPGLAIACVALGMLTLVTIAATEVDRLDQRSRYRVPLGRRTLPSRSDCMNRTRGMQRSPVGVIR